jgi:hypothetical protein
MSTPWRRPATGARPRARMRPGAFSIQRRRPRNARWKQSRRWAATATSTSTRQGRLLRDAKLYEIGAGTSEIRRMLIGREMFGGNRLRPFSNQSRRRGVRGVRHQPQGDLQAQAVVDEAGGSRSDGGGQAARERHVSRGKMLPRERVARLLDPGSPFLEIGRLAAHEAVRRRQARAGVIAGVGRVEGRE